MLIHVLMITLITIIIGENMKQIFSGSAKNIRGILSGSAKTCRTLGLGSASLCKKGFDQRGLYLDTMFIV